MKSKGGQPGEAPEDCQPLQKFILMKRPLLIVFLLLTGGLFTADVLAQQLPLYGLYRENWGVINPAAVSGDFFRYDYELSVGLTYRRQWVNIEGAPQTQQAYAEFVPNSRQIHGLLGGLYVQNDQIGPLGQTGAYIRLAGITLTDDPTFGALNIGATAGLVQYRLRTEDLRPRDPGDIKTLEPQREVKTDVSAGLFFYRDMGLGGYQGSFFFAGLSASQILEQATIFENVTDEYRITREAHFHGMAGIYIAPTDQSYIEASAWAKYAENTPLQIDFNIRYQMDNVLWIGGGYSTAHMMLLEGGLLLRDIGSSSGAGLRIGYGYSTSFSEFGPAFGSTHEINLTYLFSPDGGSRYF